ncbi:MAG: UvrD-helicase domain-containing protein, partial [Chlamydiia bacterium]|nr:UvrD-helicase domain-containing protein [Chlamydiia bacterium]
MEAFDCLSNTTDIWGHYFLQASAGTGKTFTIEHIVIRALIEATPI